MTIRTYSSPEAFKQALEQRIRTSAKNSAEFTRKRQLLVFNRFLARIVAVLGDAATLKGGLVLELRIERARTTKDIDLLMTGSPDDILARLQEAARRDLGDFLTFEVGRDHDHPDIQNDGMQYDGLRFRSECRLAGKIYGQRFGVDVAFGDPILGEPEVVVAEDLLAFAGIAPPTLRVYPIETHIAEKLHAYTMPRTRPNSRVKDLPDIALLATAQAIGAKRLRDALEQPFTFRKTHSLPERLPEPLSAWETPYAAMAREDQLAWPTLDEVTEAAKAFLDPVLAGELDAVWDPPNRGGGPSAPARRRRPGPDLPEQLANGRQVLRPEPARAGHRDLTPNRACLVQATAQASSWPPRTAAGRQARRSPGGSRSASHRAGTSYRGTGPSPSRPAPPLGGLSKPKWVFRGPSRGAVRRDCASGVKPS